VTRFPEESVDVSVNQANDTDPKRGMRWCGLTEQNARQEQ
jgi:hypothetical protein